jgi:Cys-tRNA(Pro)/Cys-tRNA(Cys) deacylase
MKANNVTRMLDSRKVPYQAFELPNEKRSALEAAEALGVPPETVYKTIVVTRVVKGKPILAVVPGPSEVDLKSLAKTLGEKKVVIPTQKEAERMTRLQAGGISPLALINRGFQVVVDTSAETIGEIYVSGGQRGINICLSTESLVKLTNAIVASICH